jgi:hypothetical protein
MSVPYQPVEDIRHAQKIDAVVLYGRCLNRQALDGFLRRRGRRAK